MAWDLLSEIKSNVKISDLLSTRYTKTIDCPCCNRVKKASIINNEFVYCFSASCGFKADVIGLNSYLLFGTKDKYKESIKDLVERFNIKTKTNIDTVKYSFYKEVNNIYINDLEGNSLQYLLNRGLALDTIKMINIGYASGTNLRSNFSRSLLNKYGCISSYIK